MTLSSIGSFMMVFLGIAVFSAMCYLISFDIMADIDLTLEEEEGLEILEVFKNGIRNSQWD